MPVVTCNVAASRRCILPDEIAGYRVKEIVCDSFEHSQNVVQYSPALYTHAVQLERVLIGIL